jgi:hypothetical protein
MFGGTEIYPCFFLCDLSLKDTGTVCAPVVPAGAVVMINNSYL